MAVSSSGASEMTTPSYLSIVRYNVYNSAHEIEQLIGGIKTGGISFHILHFLQHLTYVPHCRILNRVGNDCITAHRHLLNDEVIAHIPR